MTPDPRSAGAPSPAPDDAQNARISELVARCVEALERDGRAAVDVLLAAHPDLASPAGAQLARLEQAGLLAGEHPVAAAAAMPATIGPYRILERIGAGGMGEVYLAQQREPVQRRVALKVIKLGMDTREVIARFEVERQALALMTHENIARVYDAGATVEGRPYFAMEYVPGTPLTEYCDTRRSDTHERIELLVRVCDAVQHAHHKGIIHRDLKPSNVLVMEQDGHTVPKVIDFGVAKATGQGLGGATAHTLRGAIVGTPEYMSPEQAARGALDVDTRTDVYALGVILYELLTGGLPFPSERLRCAGVDEMVGIICAEDPPRPSTRVTPETEQGRQTARARSTDATALRQHLRGDLDWIVLKALEKDRNRRYPSPNDLAADLQRYLADEVVGARPPSTVYRVGKFVRRHRLAVALSLSAVTALVAGLVVSLRFYFAAAASAARAERALGEADAARGLAQANFDRAMQAVDDLLTRVGDVSLAEVPQMEAVRRDLLQRALGFYQGFLAQKSDDPAIRRQVALAHDRVGRLHQYLGDHRAGATSHAAALAALDALAATPADPHLEQQRAIVQINLATARRDLGESDAARQLFATAIDGLRRLRPRLPPARFDRQQLALALGYLSDLDRPRDPDRARDYARQALDELQAILADNADDVAAGATAVVFGLTLATVELGRGDTAAAEALFDRVRTDAERLAKLAPERVDVRRARGYAHDQLAILYHDTGRGAQAQAVARQGVTLWRELVAAYPLVADFRSALGRALANLGGFLAMGGETSDALACRREAIAVQEALCASFPATVQHRYRLVRGLLALAVDLRSSGNVADLPEASQMLARAHELAERIHRDEPDNADYGQVHAQVLREIGELATERGDGNAARQAYATACELATRLIAAHPDRLELRDAHALVRHALAELALAAGDAETARQEAERGIVEIRVGLAKEARQPSRRNHMHSLLHVHCRALLARGDHAAARADLEELGSYSDACRELCSAARVATAASARPDAGEHAAWYRARALEWLRAAAGKGLAKEMLEDERFAALRGDPEFVAISRSLGGQ